VLLRTCRYSLFCLYTRMKWLRYFEARCYAVQCYLVLIFIWRVPPFTCIMSGLVGRRIANLLFIHKVPGLNLGRATSHHESVFSSVSQVGCWDSTSKWTTNLYLQIFTCTPFRVSLKPVCFCCGNLAGPGLWNFVLISFHFLPCIHFAHTVSYCRTFIIIYVLLKKYSVNWRGTS
jgi:hypothetical protein